MVVLSTEVKYFINFQRKYNNLGARKIQQEVIKEFNIYPSVTAITNLI